MVAGGDRTRRNGVFWEVLSFVRKDRVARVSALVVSLVFVCALVAPLLPRIGLPNPYEMNLRLQVAPPSSQHLLGTDSFGRDLLSRIVFGARVSVTIGFVAVGIASIIGLTLGLLCGYYRGHIDQVIMRIMDAFLALPPILLALTLVGFLGPGARNVMIALGIVYTPRLTRVIRAKVISVRYSDYVQAARAIGAGEFRILFRHIFPNSFGTYVVQSTVSYAYAIIAEAGMSFLGLGTQPPTSSWGLILSEARPYIKEAPWFILFPGIAISVSVLAITLLGDRLREAIDPKQRAG